MANKIKKFGISTQYESAEPEREVKPAPFAPAVDHSKLHALHIKAKNMRNSRMTNTPAYKALQAEILQMMKAVR